MGKEIRDPDLGREDTEYHYEFKAIECSSPDSFSETVSEHLKYGWEFLGPMTTQVIVRYDRTGHPTNDFRVWYYGTMTRTRLKTDIRRWVAGDDNPDW